MPTSGATSDAIIILQSITQGESVFLMHCLIIIMHSTSKYSFVILDISFSSSVLYPFSSPSTIDDPQ